MKKNQRFIIWGVVALAVATSLGLSIKSYLQEREQAKIQQALFPLIIEQGACNPAFVVNSESTLMLYCEAQDGIDKNSVRESALSILKNWAQGGKYQDKFLAVSFTDEIMADLKK